MYVCYVYLIKITYRLGIGSWDEKGVCRGRGAWSHENRVQRIQSSAAMIFFSGGHVVNSFLSRVSTVTRDIDIANLSVCLSVTFRDVIYPMIPFP